MAETDHQGNGKVPRLSEAALDDLRRSGLSDVQIRACGLFSLADPGRVAELLRWKGPAKALGECLVFPYCHADGSPNGYHRLKPAQPRKGKRDGKPVKYEAPAGLPNRAYFPPGTVPALKDPNVPLLVTEGEKKAAKADQEGFTCIGLAGVYAWQKKRPRHDGKPTGPRELIEDLASIPWQGRVVYILFDSDAAENPHVRWGEWHLGQALAARGAVVKVVRLPPGDPGPDGKPAKMGLDDYLIAHPAGDLGRLLEEASEACRPAPKGGEDEGEDGEQDRRRGPSAATILVNLARAAGVELFHGPDQAGYATVPVAGRHETWPLRSKGFRRWLALLFFQAEEKAAGGQAILDALNTLEGRAAFGAPEKAVHVRVAGYEGKVYLDLADPLWRAVEVDAQGWRLVAEPPVKFIRPRGLLPLPEPVRGGSLGELRRFVNVAGDDDWRLLVAWLLQALRPQGPYPVLCQHGEQGSAKSTTARVVRSLIDPSLAPLRTRPRDERDLMIAATNSRVVAFDNLSSLAPWLSDALCRLATGGGFSTRELYTDREEVIFDAMRPCLLTGIEDLATRGDLLERGLILRLPRIPEDRRRAEEEFWPAFEEARPRILGALLDAVAGALRELPNTRLDRLPRMADFARWAAAAEPALAWEPGSFLRSYAGNQEDANELALEASPLVGPLRQLAEAAGGWEGKAADLLPELTGLAGDAARSPEWPKRANILSNRLRRLAPNLRRVGIQVDFDRQSDRQRTRIVRVALVAEREGKRPSAASNTVRNGELARKDSPRADDPRPAADDPADDGRAAKGPSADDADGLDGLLHSLSDSEVIE
jgi:hypothetical protein